MKNAIAISLLLGIATPLWSGDYSDYGKAPLPVKNPIVEECYDLGGVISSGYTTDYLVHGLRVNRDTVWADVNYSFEAMVPLNFGVTHSSGIDKVFPYNVIGPIDVTDLYLVASFENVAGFTIDLSYTQHFLNFSGANVFNGSYGDIGIDIRRELGIVDFVIGADLGLNSRNAYFAGGGGDGWVYYAGMEKSFQVCEVADLVVAGGVGYQDGYFFSAPAQSSGWSNYYLTAALPMQLNCRTTISPYIGYNGVQQWNVFAPQGDALLGGVSIAVKF